MPKTTFADDDDDGIRDWRSAYETVRRAAEDSCRKAEKARRSAEGARQQAEQHRILAESSRKQAELARAAATEARKAAVDRLEKAQESLAEAQKQLKESQPYAVRIALPKEDSFTPDDISKILDAISSKTSARITYIKKEPEQVAKPHGLRDRLRAAFRELFN
ncbi:hypothetical protein [Corynebacterium phoceense]